MQGVWENSVLSRFRDTLYKVRRKWEKSAFFARRYAKSVRKQCSFTFFKTLCTKFAENKQNQRILSFFCDVPQNVWVNSVFSRPLRHFVQSSQKMRKTAFFELFARRSAKSVKKRCFFTFFETLCTKFAKKFKNSVFFCATLCKECEKTVFFNVFQDTLYKVRKKCWKTAFLSILVVVPRKVWENWVFSLFPATFRKKY